ncbi:MAG: hypothetical protein SGBAC_007324 [Bacillariaceae sp.]
MEIEKPPESVEEAGALLGATITVYGVADSYKLNKAPQGTHSSFSTISPVPSSELFVRLHTLRSLLRSAPTDTPLVAAPSLLAGVLMKLLGVSNKLANVPPNPKNKRRVAIPPMLSTPIRKVWVDCVVLCHSLGEGLSGNARINTFGFVRNMIQLASLNPRTAKAAGGIRTAALEAIEGIMKDPKLSIQLASWAFDVTRVCQKAVKSSGNGEPTFRVVAVNTAMSVVIASRNAFMKTRPVEGSARLVLKGALDDKAVMEMLKLIKTAVSDKFPEVRTAVARLAALIAPQVIHTAIKSPRTPDAAASFTASLEDIMTIAFKNLDDTSAECAAAWAEALARCMSTAIEVGAQQSAEEGSQRDVERPDARNNNRQKGRKTTTRKGVLAAENCSTLPKTLKYLVSVFVKAGGELVANKTGGTFSKGGRAVRLGFTRSIIQLLRLQQEIKAIGDGKNIGHKEAILIILSMVGNDMEAQLKSNEKKLGLVETLDATSVVTASTIREAPLSGRSVGQTQGNALFGQQPKVSHADAPIVRLCTSRVLREGILDLSPETTQIAVLHEFIDLCVNRQGDLKGNQLQVILTEISHLYARLGEAAQSSLEDFAPALKDCLRHADHGVRHEAAVVCAAITAVFPAVGRQFIDDGIRDIQMEHAELMASASAGAAESAAENSGGRRFGFGRRNAPNKKESKPDSSLKHQFAIHGISLMVTMILRDLPGLPGGLPMELLDDVMSSTEVLCSAYDNDVLVNGSPSGVCTCVRAGFAMICGVLATGPDTIAKHIERIFGSWQKFSKLPTKGNRFTPDHELLCVEAMLSSILVFLRNCSSLLLSVPDALTQVTMALERLLPRFHNGDGTLRKCPDNPAAALRLDTAKACIMEAFSWLPPGSYPMVADPLFAFAARHIQIAVDHDVSCSILPLLISNEDKILDATSFCRAAHQGQVGGLRYLDEDITARAAEASHHTDRESALLFYSTSGNQQSSVDFLGSQILGTVVSKGVEQKPPTELHSVGSWHTPATPSCSSKVRLVDASIQAFAATFTLKSPKEQQRALKMLESLVPPMHFQATRGPANDQGRRGKGKEHNATFTNVTAVLLSCLKALPVNESTHNIAVGIGPTWMSQAKDVLLNVLPCQSPFVRRGAAEGLAILSTLGVKEDAHFLQSEVIHSLDEVFKGTYTAGQANQMPPESISAASATALLALGCIQRTSSRIHDIRVEQSKLRGSPQKTRKEDDEDEILPTLQMMARVLPSANCGLRAGFFGVRAHALHAFGLLLSYSNKLIGISLGEEEMQLLKKLVFIVEDNFLASWTTVTTEKDQGNEVEKLAGEPSFLAILLRLMTFLVPSLHHLQSVDPTVSLRFSQMASTIVAIAGAHPTVAIEATAFYEVSTKNQHIFRAYLSGVKYSEQEVLCSIPFLMQNLEPSRSLVEPDYVMIQPSCSSSSPDIFAATRIVIRELTLSQVLVTELSDLRILSLLFAALEDATSSRSFNGETKHRGIAAPREIEAVYVSEAAVEPDMLDLLRLIVYVEGRTSDNCETTFLRILLLSRVLLLGTSGTDEDDDNDDDTPLTPTEVAKEALQRALSDATEALGAASPMRWQVKCMVMQMAIMALEVLVGRVTTNRQESPIFNPKIAKEQCFDECRIYENDPTILPESKLALHIDALVAMACVTATCTVDQTELRILQACAMPLLSRIVLCFGSIPDPGQADANVLHDYIPQISSCIKSALGAVDEDEGASSCRLFMVACESLESFLQSEVCEDVAVLKRVIRPALPASDELPFFCYDENMPFLTSSGAKAKSSNSRAILLIRIGKLGVLGSISTEDFEFDQMIEADTEGLGSHAAALAVDGARLLLGSQSTLAGGYRTDNVAISRAFYSFNHADEIDDVVKAALVHKWAGFASNAMGQLSDSIANGSEKSDGCKIWLQKIVPLIFAGTHDAITASKSANLQRRDVNWISGMDVATVLCDCLQAVNLLVSKPVILSVDDEWSKSVETTLSEIAKEILLPALVDGSNGSNARVVAASCALLESLVKTSALELSSESPLLLSLMFPLEQLQKGSIRVTDTHASMVVSACLKVVGSIVSKPATPTDLVKAMLQFIVTSSHKDTPENVKLSTHFLLRECMKHTSISSQDQSMLASKMIKKRDFDGWAVIVQTNDGLAANASFEMLQQLLLGSSHEDQIGAATAICELVQNASSPSPIIGRVTAVIGVEILAVFQMYGTLTVLKEYHVHRTNICASCIKFVLAAIPQFTSDSVVDEEIAKFLVVIFMALIPVVRYNGLPNHPLPNGQLSDPAIGRMCAQTMVHIARTAPVPFKTSMTLMNEQDRAVLEFAVRSDMTGYAVAAKAPVKKKLNLKGFKK